MPPPEMAPGEESLFSNALLRGSKRKLEEVLDGGEVGVVDVLQRLGREGLAWNSLQLLVARRLDLGVGERLAAVVIHLKALVVVEQR